MIKLTLITSILLSMFSLQNCTPNGGQVKHENRPRPDWLQEEYNDAVMIEPFNSVEQDGFFLIDQPIDFAEGITPTFFLTTMIPLELFKNSEAFYPELKEFVLVVPDWDYYQKTTGDAHDNGITLEPITSNYYYRFVRTEDSVKVDDYYIQGEGQPVLNYKIPAVSKIENLIVYREEQYGSVCCPRDEKHSLAEQDSAFITSYETKNHVSIEGTYRQTNGKEGEHINYYTLQGISSAKRLAFLLAKNKQWQLDGQGVFNPDEKRVITPKVVAQVNEGRMKMHLVDME